MDSLARHTDYGSIPLLETDLDAHPLRQLVRWLEDAETAGVFEPNAMVLGTVDPDGAPSSRTVLLKGIGDETLTFVTNFRSRKGRAIAAHPDVTLLFPWYSLRRQVIVEGRASLAAPAVSDRYFVSRPHDSRVAALASEQSAPIAGRDDLETRFRDAAERYPDGTEVPRPQHWGGVEVRVHRLEFWQGRRSRLHDRLRYERDDSTWRVVRLQP